MSRKKGRKKQRNLRLRQRRQREAATMSREREWRLWVERQQAHWARLMAAVPHIVTEKPREESIWEDDNELG